MKTRFNTHDIMCMVTELQRLIGMRVNQVYDIDNRTYVIRLQQSEEKCVLLLESGNRFHTTHFEWPKNAAPSGFTMKLRKHLKNKRLEKLSQIGVDRIVELQFGTGEAAYHVVLELYDRGNIVLADYQWTILNVLRPHVEGDKVRFAVKEKYPLDRAKRSYAPPPEDMLKDIILKARPNDTLKKVLNPHLEFGSALIDHVLLENGLTGNMKLSKEPGKGFNVEDHLEKLVMALKLGEAILEDAGRKNENKGYITQKRVERPNPEGQGTTFLLTNQEFHPMLYNQVKEQPHAEYESFDRAVDEFFSTLEGQKIDMKTVQIEREAMKKLQNVRNDHEKRVSELQQTQAEDRVAAELIARNEPLVEQARMAIQAAIANQMTWDDIRDLVKSAQDSADPVASCITALKLSTNHISLALRDPYDQDEELKPMVVDIDLSLTAFANARRYYDQKRNAAKKQQKTLESADKALKSAERKTKQTLKEAQTVSNIIKARKTFWFEKFYWFISSDNYLVIAGRDQQQNELLVKRYMRACDVYVHADVSGAASVLVRNPRKGPAPPRTLGEAAHAAVGYSVAWEAKVVCGAWWVWGRQVSKSAPTGEFLSTGSFMIRGKKNYLLCDQLSFGFSFLFRLEDSCIDRHREDRKPISAGESSDVTDDVTPAQDQDEQEIVVSDDDDDSEKEENPNPYADSNETKLKTIAEESQQKETDSKSEKEDTTSLIDKKQKNTSQVSKADTTSQVDKDVTSQDKKEDVTSQVDKKETHDGKHEGETEMENESSDDDFPDTHIKVDHGTGEVILQSKARTMSEASDKSEDKLSFPTLPKKGTKKPPRKQEQRKGEESKRKEEGPKRGQRGKMRKMKEKYADQDEEDREIALLMLQSAKEEKDSKKSTKKSLSKGGKSKQSQRGPKIPAPAPLILEAESEGEEHENEEADDAAEGVDVDGELVTSLCGAPTADDELLFAVPVVAPYSALLNYKYKVKLTPGTSKRGKAAKTAMQVFLRDKAATPRERDLLKAVKEENIARNFPGKVKLSAPSLHKHKK